MRWILNQQGQRFCGSCNIKPPWNTWTPYCPYCGKKMHPDEGAIINYAEVVSENGHTFEEENKCKNT